MWVYSGFTFLENLGSLQPPFASISASARPSRRVTYSVIRQLIVRMPLRFDVASVSLQMQMGSGGIAKKPIINMQAGLLPANVSTPTLAKFLICPRPSFVNFNKCIPGFRSADVRALGFILHSVQADQIIQLQEPRVFSYWNFV